MTSAAVPPGRTVAGAPGAALAAGIALAAAAATGASVASSRRRSSTRRRRAAEDALAIAPARSLRVRPPATWLLIYADRG